MKRFLILNLKPLIFEAEVKKNVSDLFTDHIMIYNNFILTPLFQGWKLKLDSRGKFSPTGEDDRLPGIQSSRFSSSQMATVLAQCLELWHRGQKKPFQRWLFVKKKIQRIFTFPKNIPFYYPKLLHVYMNGNSQPINTCKIC